MIDQVPSLCNKVDSKETFSTWAFIIIVLFFIGIFLLLFLRLPLSAITQVEIKGGRLVTAESVMKRLPTLKGSSFFLVSTAQIKKSLQFFPEVKEVEVTRYFPNKVCIVLKEKKIIGLLRSASQLYPVLEDGRVMKSAYFNLEMHDKPILEGWEFPNTTVQLACAHLSNLSKEVLSQLLRIKPVPKEPDQVEIVTRRHHRIFVRSADLSRKLTMYPSFLGHPPGTLYLLESIWFRPEKYSS